MQPMRVFFLLRMDLKYQWHKFKSDWLRELAAILSALILFAVFFYIASDFLNVKVGEIDDSYKAQSTFWFSAATMLMSGFMLGRYVKRHYSEDGSVYNFSKRLGEVPKIIKVYKFSGVTIMLLLGSTVIGSLTMLTVGQSLLLAEGLQIYFASVAGIIISQIPLMALSTISKIGLVDRLAIGNRSCKVEFSQRLQVGSWGRLLAMTRFRIRQMIFRNIMTRIFLLVAILFTVGIVYLSWSQTPFFLIGILAIALSFLLAIPPLIQLKDDLAYAWSERTMGVSHNEIVKVYALMSLILSLPSALVISVFSYFAGYAFENSLKLAIISLLASLLLPALMFQVEPRKPIISAIAIFMINLFLATAVLVHLASGLLIPIVFYYAAKYQMGRYYGS